MTVPSHTYDWEQGTDLVLRFVYREGETPATAIPVNLTGYSLRMDGRAGSIIGDVVWTFSSIDDADPTTIEATLGTAGQITITLPRSLTLPGGAVYVKMNGNPSVTVFVSDIILRDLEGKQAKILSATISVKPSATLWV